MTTPTTEQTTRTTPQPVFTWLPWPFWAAALVFAIVGTAAETLGGAIAGVVAFIGAVAVIAVMVRRTR